MLQFTEHTQSSLTPPPVVVPSLHKLHNLEAGEDPKTIGFYTFLDKLQADLQRLSPDYQVVRHSERHIEDSSQAVLGAHITYKGENVIQFDTSEDYEEIVEQGVQHYQKKKTDLRGKTLETQEVLATPANLNSTRVPIRVNDGTGEEIPLKHVDSVPAVPTGDSEDIAANTVASPIPISDVRHITFWAHPVEYQQLLEKEVLEGVLEHHKRLGA